MSYIIRNDKGFYYSNQVWSKEQRCAIRFDSLDVARRVALNSQDWRIVKLVPRKPKASLSAQVSEFHDMIGEPSPDHPDMHDKDDVRLRLALILEETIELMEASGMSTTWLEGMNDLLVALRNNIVQVAPGIVAMTDALADLQYVTEGSFQRLGINSGPILAEVHRSNMAKRGAGKDANGKWKKPDGWTPPDIAGELRKQGWRSER